MTWRSLSLVFALGLMGCPPEDPTETDDDTSDVDTSDVDTSDIDTDTDDIDTEAPAIDCHVLPSTLPAWGGDIDPPTLITNTPYTNDAGLGGLLAALDGTTGDQTVDVDITGATVTVLDYNRDEDLGQVFRFYVEDANAAFFARLSFDATGYDIQAGDIVNFNVTAAQLYFGVPQISAISELTVVSSGNPVHVIEGNGQTLDLTGDVNRVHHLYGELVSAGEGCQDPNYCFDLETVDGETSTINTLRINQEPLQTPLIQGDCVEIIAPMGIFSEAPQFNVGNYEWHRWYGNVDE